MKGSTGSLWRAEGDVSLPLSLPQSEELHSYFLTLSFCLNFILKMIPMAFCWKTLLQMQIKGKKKISGEVICPSHKAH